MSFWGRKPTPEEEAMMAAAMHLRLTLAGFSSYSATPSEVDLGWARLLLQRLRGHGYELAPTTEEAERQKRLLVGS